MLLDACQYAFTAHVRPCGHASLVLNPFVAEQRQLSLSLSLSLVVKKFHWNSAQQARAA